MRVLVIVVILLNLILTLRKYSQTLGFGLSLEFDNISVNFVKFSDSMSDRVINLEDFVGLTMIN